MIVSKALIRLAHGLGSGCGSVARAVASDTRDARFESSRRQTFIEYLFTVNCLEKTKIKKKDAGNGPLKKCGTWFHERLLYQLHDTYLRHCCQIFLKVKFYFFYF